jgi:CheY-like chemotaxis protein
MLQRTGHTVLLIEADRSLRRLIALGLQYRGMHVIETSFPPDLAGHFTSPDFCEAKIDAPASLEVWLQKIFESQQPDVVVLDIDSEAGSDHALLSTIQSQPCLSTVPMVVLAWDCLIPIGNHQNTPQTQVTCLTKPFDARTLLATIEQIQYTSAETSLTSKQEALLAARSVTSAPSIWPLITAVGLLLSFIGLMTQITISVLGLLIIIVALLLWTIGTKTEGETLAFELSNI